MRHHIEHLSSTKMQWKKLSAGVYVKMLNHNMQSGERTGLFHFVPEEGAAPPNISHYHSISEELFILDGRMTFDHQTWLGKYAYVYHPPFLVHGFNSSIPVPTTFIGRSNNDLDFNYPDNSKASKPYYIQGKPAPRGLAHLNFRPETEWEPLLSPVGQEIGQQNILSQDPRTKEGSKLIRFHKGSKFPERPQGYEFCNEGFILEGRVEAEDGTVWEKGDYWHRHPGKRVQRLEILKQTLVFSTETLPDA